MNILHISSSHENDKLHAFSYHFKNVCKKLGYNIKSYSPFRDDIILPYMKEDEDFKSLYTGQQVFPLSRILNNCFPEANFIFIENPKFFFNNDVSIPVFYYHRDLKCSVYVSNPTHLGLRFWSLALQDLLQYMLRILNTDFPHTLHFLITKLNIIVYPQNQCL